MKTLGQIAWEAQFCGGNDKGWQYEPAHVQSNWEEIGQAVRAAVIEECAKAADALWLESNGTHPWEYEGNVSEAIRSLK